jgi:hypothetical protein
MALGVTIALWKEDLDTLQCQSRYREIPRPDSLSGAIPFATPAPISRNLGKPPISNSLILCLRPPKPAP